MNNLIKTSWINDIAKAHEIKEAIHPSFVSKLAQDVEQQVRRVIQDARVFQRRSKKSTLTVGDLNLALEANQQERIYGLGVIEDKLKGPGAGSNTESSLCDSAMLKLSDVLAKRRAPIVPLQPRVELHWLAVDGVQPLIPENPSSNRLHKTTRQSQAEGVSSASEYTTIPETFSREIQVTKE